MGRHLDDRLPGRGVIPAAENATIPAGGSVTAGFVGVDEGAYPSPAVFRINGTICTTQ
ncbi:cellulose binding domain-containing protein [Streptosporangium sp. LJ11]|uniref:cellulose binding domain-containing protein n=1 Tax=Streptosporangium sp. LJ11 TaxID=3436927 RepID=UPI003F791A39